MMMYKYMFILGIFLSASFLHAEKIHLERPSSVRLQEYLRQYELQEKKRKQKKILTYGVGSAAALGLGFYGASYLRKRSKAKTDTRVVNQDARENNSLFKKALVFSSATLLINMLGHLVYDKLFPFIGNVLKIKKRILWLPYAKRLEVSIDRLCLSMRELQEYGENEALVSHHTLDVVDAFSLFVYSLEKFCAVMLYEMKTKKSFDETILMYWGNLSDRLFLYLERTAGQLERDLNREDWDGLEQESFDLVGGLRTITLSFLSDYATLNLQEQKHEEE